MDQELDRLRNLPDQEYRVVSTENNLNSVNNDEVQIATTQTKMLNIVTKRIFSVIQMYAGSTYHSPLEEIKMHSKMMEIASHLKAVNNEQETGQERFWEFHLQNTAEQILPLFQEVNIPLYVSVKKEDHFKLVRDPTFLIKANPVLDAKFFDSEVAEINKRIPSLHFAAKKS